MELSLKLISSVFKLMSDVEYLLSALILVMVLRSLSATLGLTILMT